MEGMRNRFLSRSLRILTWKSSNKLSGPVALWVRRCSLMSFWHCQHVPGGSTPPWSALSVYLYLCTYQSIRQSAEISYWTLFLPPKTSAEVLQKHCQPSKAMLCLSDSTAPGRMEVSVFEMAWFLEKKHTGNLWKYMETHWFFIPDIGSSL